MAWLVWKQGVVVVVLVSPRCGDTHANEPISEPSVLAAISLSRWQDVRAVVVL